MGHHVQAVIRFAIDDGREIGQVEPGHDQARVGDEHIRAQADLFVEHLLAFAGFNRSLENVRARRGDMLPDQLFDARLNIPLSCLSHKDRAATSLGYAGQYILIVPDRNLIMVTTSGFQPQEFFTPETLFNQYILPASESSKPLPPNPDAIAALKARLVAMARPPEPKTPPRLPETALRISGKSYSLEPSDVGWRSLVLNFAPGQNTAQVILDGVSLTVGLDEVYRSSPPDPAFRGSKQASWLLRGRWIAADTFEIELIIVGRPERYTENLHFEGDKMTVRETEHVTGRSATTTGEVKR